MAIISAIGAVLGAAGTFLGGTALGGFVLKGAVGVGLSLASRALAGDPKAAKPVFSVEGELQAGGDLGRSFLMGRSITAGSLVYANTFGEDSKAKNTYLVQVIALSDLPVGELFELWVDGKKVTLGTQEALGRSINEYRRDGSGRLWIRFYDGTQTAADSLCVARFGSHATHPYSSTRVGVGVAYAVMIARIDEDLYDGFPEYKFVTTGLKLYDPSKDSSVGGNGAHRWPNPATWGGDGDDLPAVQEYAILRGITFQGKWFYGLQALPAARLPIADWIAAVQKCRLQIAVTGGTEPQYRAGGEIKVVVPAADAIEQFNTACHGRLSESGGVYKLRVGTPDAAAATIDDGVILSTEEQTFTPFFGLADTVNGIAGKYPNPDEAWNMKDAPALYRPDLEAKDGGRRLMSDVSFDLVPYAYQVQRLMKSAIEEALRARRHTFTLPPEYWTLETGDTLAWSSERWGYATKLFRLDGVMDLANADIMVDATEVDPNDFIPPATYTPVVTGPTLSPAIPPQGVQDFAVSGVDVVSPDGRKRPGIKLTWNGVDQDDVVAVGYEVRLASSLVVVERGQSANVAAGEVIIAPGSLIPTTGYEVKGRFVPGGDRVTLWTPWLSVTTTNARFGAGDLYDAELGWSKLAPEVTQFQADTQSALDAAIAWRAEEVNWRADALAWRERASRDLIRPILDSVAAITLRIADQDFSNFADKQQIRAELSVTRDGLAAGYTNLVTTAVGEMGGQLVGVSQRVETLEVALPGLASGSAVSALEIRVTAAEDGVTSLGTALTAIQTELPGKAAASAVTALTTRVSDVEGVNSSQAAAIASVQTELPNKASAASVSSLSNTVTSQGQTIEAQGQAISGVQAALPGKADASALQTLEGRVTSAEGVNTSQATAITAVQAALPGKADVAITDGLDARVTQTATGLSSVGQTTRQVINTLGESAFRSADGDLSAFAQDAAVRSANATTFQQLTTLLAVEKNRIDVSSGAILALQSTLPSLATADALTTLNTTVSYQGESLMALSSAVTAVQAVLPNKADASAVTALEARVTSAEGVNTSQATAITSINSTLPGKADASVVSALQTQVTTVETTANGRNRVFRQGTAPAATAIGDLWIHTGENNRLYRASATGAASWVLSEDPRVPQLVTDVASQASAITGVQASYADVSASSTFRASASAGPTGYASRVALQARTGPTDAWRTAAIFLDVPETGPTRVVVTADRFVVTDGDAVLAPFEVSGGVVKMKQALIPTLTTGLIKSAAGKQEWNLDAGTFIMSDDS